MIPSMACSWTWSGPAAAPAGVCGGCAGGQVGGLVGHLVGRLREDVAVQRVVPRHPLGLLPALPPELVAEAEDPLEVVAVAPHDCRIGRLIGAMRSRASGRSVRALTRAASRICMSSKSRIPVCTLTGATSPIVRPRNSCVGRLAGDTRPQDSAVPVRQFEQHLARVADAYVPETVRVHLRVPGDVTEDGQLVLELKRRAVHDLHALPGVDHERAPAVEAEVDLRAVPPPPACVAGREKSLHDVRPGTHPFPQPADPAPAIAVGEEDEREPSLVSGRAHHVGHVQAVARLRQVVRRWARGPRHVLHEDRLAGIPVPRVLALRPLRCPAGSHGFLHVPAPDIGRERTRHRHLPRGRQGRTGRCGT